MSLRCNISNPTMRSRRLDQICKDLISSPVLMIGFEILRPIVACYIVNYYFSNTTFEQTDMLCLNMKQIPCANINPNDHITY